MLFNVTWRTFCEDAKPIKQSMGRAVTEIIRNFCYTTKMEYRCYCQYLKKDFAPSILVLVDGKT
jgi:hypothetical protein